MKKVLYILFWNTILVCCKNEDSLALNEKSEQVSSNILDSILIANSQINDTSNQYIYDFIKIFIDNENINLNYGLKLEPEENCDISMDDINFLKTLLIDDDKSLKNDNENWQNVTVSISNPKILTIADIDTMLLQKVKLNEFMWDNSRLGFNLENKEYWYVFSRPLFTQDKKCVIMMVRELCQGLCGNGRTVFYIYDDNRWTSTSSFTWYH